MVPIATLDPAKDQAPKSVITDSAVFFARCGSDKTLGIAYLTTWGFLCLLCNDDYWRAHGAGEEGF